jgi:hypothetical protein
VATFLFWIFAATLTKFGMSHDSWVRAMKQNIFKGLIGEVGSFKNVLEVLVRETYTD